MTSILFFARHAALTALFAATAWAAGRVVVRRWAHPAPAALTIAVGLAVLAQLLFLLGTIGWLRPLPMLGLATAAHLLAAPDWLRLAGASRRIGQELATPTGAGALAAGGFALLLWVLTLYPPVAFD